MEQIPFVRTVTVLEMNYKERSEAVACYLIENKSTVRATAIRFGISKSTVHKDISERLRSVNRGLYEQAREILDINKAERHLRGGEATKIKYKAKLSKAEK